MPAAPRVKTSKATKIAWKILGKPEELRRTGKPRTRAERVIEGQALFYR